MISQAKQNGNHIKLPFDFKVNKIGAIARFRGQGKLCIVEVLLEGNGLRTPSRRKLGSIGFNDR